MNKEKQRQKALDIVNALIEKGLCFSMRTYISPISIIRKSGYEESKFMIEIASRTNADEVRAAFPYEFDTKLDGGRRFSIARFEV